MPDYSDQNFNQPKAYVPPPPTEVSVRTLDSDVRTMALSGGNFSQAEKVSVAHTVKYNAMGEQQNYQPKSSVFAVIIWVLAILLFLGALSYFLYPFFDGSREDSPIVGSNSTSTKGLPAATIPIFVPEFFHRSFFVKGEKQVLDLRVNYPDDIVANTETYTKEIIRAVADQGAPDTTFFEVELNKTDGKHLALIEFFDWAKITLLQQNFWSENFSPDFNYFILKEKGTLGSGIVLRPKEGKSPLSLKKDLLRMEESKDLKKFFFTNLGEPEGGFSDFLLGGQSVRRLKFSRSTYIFAYGWYNGNLIIATSEQAFQEAINRL